MATSTTRGQRIGIWVIAGLMALGTVGSLLAVTLANDNIAKDKDRLNKMMEEYGAKLEKHNEKLSKKYFPEFSPYRDSVGEFDGEITELVKEDLKEGEGEELDEDDSAWAYYIGWLPDGRVFDSSFDASNDDIKSATSLTAPFEIENGSVIKGWAQGIEGMKTGGIRQLTIPANLAYGEAGSGDIPANSTLRFIIFIIDNKDNPEIPDDLVKLYERTEGY